MFQQPLLSSPLLGLRLRGPSSACWLPAPLRPLPLAAATSYHGLGGLKPQQLTSSQWDLVSLGPSRRASNPLFTRQKGSLRHRCTSDSGTSPPQGACGAPAAASRLAGWSRPLGAASLAGPQRSLGAGAA